MNASTTPFTATVTINKNAALLAGADEYGIKTVEITPSTLTPRQRQTLAALNFSITGSAIGGQINGLEPIESLLDLAAAELEAKQQKIDAENAASVARMIHKIKAAPLTDFLTVDAQTGIITVKKTPGALIQISNNEAVKQWGMYGLWESPAYGNYSRAAELRQTVLNHPEVAEKISQAEREAAKLNELLKQAKDTRERIRTEQEAEKRRLANAAAERRKAQLAAFVSEHMTDTQQRRYKAGLMADDEIIDAIEAQAFAPMSSYVEFSRIDNQDVIDHVAAALDLNPDCLNSSKVIVIETELHALTNDEFNRLEAFKMLLPAAQFELIQHFGCLDKYDNTDDPELLVNTCRITVQAGELSLSREYLL